jgi:hypothetical protein
MKRIVAFACLIMLGIVGISMGVMRDSNSNTAYMEEATLCCPGESPQVEPPCCPEESPEYPPEKTPCCPEIDTES